MSNVINLGRPAIPRIKLPVGHFYIYGVVFATREKPSLFHRFFARVFLGWKWHPGHYVDGTGGNMVVIGMGLEWKQ